MNSFTSLDWNWPAVALAFLLGALLARWFSKRFLSDKSQSVNKEYFKGLNFLLNEETDKAIDVFIKALEVDSETVELHLALGGLFRRKGQVDRATRIHQNLIARPSLTDDQRMQAVHELANDYYKAGWLDRAENLFLELNESDIYRALAITGLCKIYEQEKEWQRAIDVLKQHKRADRQQVSQQIAHYYCELAESAINVNDFGAAKTHLRHSRTEDPGIARSMLLRGDLSFAEGEYKLARQMWVKLSKNHPELAELLVAKMIRSYQLSDDKVGLKRYVTDVSAIPKDSSAFELWRLSLYEFLGEEAAIEHIFKLSHTEAMSSPLAKFLYGHIESGKLNSDRRSALLKKLLDQAKQKDIEYKCLSCGFDTKAMYWFCPNCGCWDTFR